MKIDKKDEKPQKEMVKKGLSQKKESKKVIKKPTIKKTFEPLQTVEHHILSYDLPMGGYRHRSLVRRLGVSLQEKMTKSEFEELFKNKIGNYLRR